MRSNNKLGLFHNLVSCLPRQHARACDVKNASYIGSSLRIETAYRCTPQRERWDALELLTTAMDVLTASDTLCLSSAAVPGLLNLFVNFRTSDMVLSFFSLTVIPSAFSLRQTTSRHSNLRV